MRFEFEDQQEVNRSNFQEGNSLLTLVLQSNGVIWQILAKLIFVKHQRLVANPLMLWIPVVERSIQPITRIKFLVLKNCLSELADTDEHHMINQRNSRPVLPSR